MGDWLVAHGVTRVGMEATGVYWKPVFWVLEDAVECWLLNARHMGNVPGRKTDMADAKWICRLMEHGLVRAGFVPPKEIRELRDLTRFTKTRIEERTGRPSAWTRSSRMPGRSCPAWPRTSSAARDATC